MPDQYGSSDGSRTDDILAVASAIIEGYCNVPANEGLYEANRTRFQRGYRLADGGYRIELGKMPVTQLNGVKVLHGSQTISSQQLDLIDTVDRAVIITADEAQSISAAGLAVDFEVTARMGWGSSGNQPPDLAYAANVIGDRLVAQQSLGGIPPNVSLPEGESGTTPLLDGLEVVLRRFVL